MNKIELRAVVAICISLVLSAFASSPAVGEEAKFDSAGQHDPNEEPTEFRELGDPYRSEPDLSEIGDYEHLAITGVPSTEATALALHPDLQSIGQRFPDTIQFAHRLDYHLIFRSQFDFLDSDVDSLVEAFESPSREALLDLGLEMTEADYVEIERRDRLTAAAIEISRETTGRLFDAEEEKLEAGSRLDTGPLFAGIWMDQLNRGVLVLAVTDAGKVDFAALAELLPAGEGPESLRVVEQSHSLDDLYQIRSVLFEELGQAGIRATLGFESGPDGRVIGIYPANADDREALSTYLSRSPDLPVQIGNISAMGDVSAPWNHHSFPTAGLQITADGARPPRTCTWGISAHTSGSTYMVTAGHCLRYQAASGASTSSAPITGLGWAEIYQPNPASSPNIADSLGYAYARNDASIGNIDLARIESYHAHSSCYHYQVDCQYQMSARLSLYGHVVGQIVCAGLGTTGVGMCGTVRDVNRDATWTTNVGSVSAGIERERIIAEMIVQGGDSGSGMMRYSTIHGLLTEFDPNNNATAFIPAYIVKINMGNPTFDYNCNNYTGSYWPACPIVYS